MLTQLALCDILAGENMAQAAVWRGILLATAFKLSTQ
jgi:hypothetical protein